MKNKKTIRRVRTPKPTKPINTTPPPAKKSHGCLISCIVVIVLLFLFGGAISIFGFYFGPGLMVQFFDKMFNLKNFSYDDQLSDRYQIKEVVSGDLSANVKIPSDAAQSSITLAAVPQSEWPEGTKGGMYKLEPSGSKFEKPLTISVNIKTEPGQRFSMGYWLPEKKDWEWIPTIRRGGNTYEAHIEHASYVGAYLPDWTDLSDYKYEFTDKHQQDLYADYQWKLEVIGASVDLGTYHEYTGQRWWSTRDVLEKLTDSVIKECEKENTPSRQRDFYFAWGVVQWNSFIGLDNLLNRFYDAEKTCTYQDDSATFTPAYMIEQTDKYPYEVNVYNMAKSHGEQKSVYWGLPMSAAPEGKPGWQTDWRVYADTTTDALTDINIQMAPGSQAGLAVGGTTVSRTEMIFSLKGVKVGEKFPITVKSTGSYTIHSNTEYPDLFYYDKNGYPHFDDKYVEEYDANFDAYEAPVTSGTEERNGQVQNVTTMSGILLQDMGWQGARIKMQYEGLDQVQDVMDSIANEHKGTEFYNIFFQGGNLDVSMDIPPLVIKHAARKAQ